MNLILMQSGKREGPVKYYHENGQLAIEGNLLTEKNRGYY